MPVETYTGRLNNDGAQVSIEGGPILAIRGANPCATAAGQYARFGETQPVTVTGTPGKVDNIRVLFVTSIHWAAPAPVITADDISQGGAQSIDSEPIVKPKKPARKKSARKKR
jgi:hypothetical protein